MKRVPIFRRQRILNSSRGASREGQNSFIEMNIQQVRKGEVTSEIDEKYKHLVGLNIPKI